MFQGTEIDCPILVGIADRFRSVGEFHSVFFRPETFTSIYPDFSRGDQAVLMDVLQSDFLGRAVPLLGPVNLPAASKFTTLTRYEFEGSLTGVLLQGTCTERVVADEREARSVAHAIVASVLKSDADLRAYRMDDHSWSVRTSGATLTWAYFVYFPSQRLWWFVCFADFY